MNLQIIILTQELIIYLYMIIMSQVQKEYKKNITVYESIKNKIKDQATAFTDCYQNNKNMFDWFIFNRR